jgi:hypothetical protein
LAAPFVLYFSAAADAATIFGTLYRNNQPLRSTKVILSCGKNNADTMTDDRGTYRLTITYVGRCNLRVDNASGDVILYRDPTRYDFEVTQSSLKRR